MNWSRRFDDPIKTPDGKTLRTLRDPDGTVGLALPKKVQAEPAWQHAAARGLKNAAELRIRRGRWFARSAMMHALLRADHPADRQS